MIALFVYVPYESRWYYFYDWIFNYGAQFQKNIDFKFISFKMIVWIATMWCLAFIFNNTESK
jgi:hypothetical protein